MRVENAVVGRSTAKLSQSHFKGTMSTEFGSLQQNCRVMSLHSCRGVRCPDGGTEKIEESERYSSLGLLSTKNERYGTQAESYRK